eukprot:6214099-Pleurochrysis_carterae.AAC.6
MGVPTKLCKTAFVNSTADALSATNGRVSTPALQLASYLSCTMCRTRPLLKRDRTRRRFSMALCTPQRLRGLPNARNQSKIAAGLSVYT